MNTQYSEPVATLLSLGKAESCEPWDRYLELNLSLEHVPELLQMIADEELRQADSESDAVWGPVHAWRTLGCLRAAEAVPGLLDQLYRIDKDDDDWIAEELPQVLGMIGEPAIRKLAQYLANAEHLLYARAAAADGLRQVAKKHPMLLQECATWLKRELARYAENDKILNGLIVSHFLDFKAVEALPVIKQAYQAGCVDLSICGDIEEVEIGLGVRETRSTPRPRLWLHPSSSQTEKKIGRNDPCPCSSGKKYKKCCLNSTSHSI